MSFQAMAWAVSQKTANAGQKLVLLMLANHANGQTGRCTPSHKLLADECSMGVSTLKGHIQALADAGFLRIVRRSHEGISLANQYALNLGGVGQILADPRSDSGRGVGQILATEPGIKNQEKNQEEHPPTPKGEMASGFAQFWESYPKKVGKDAAEKAWNRKVKTTKTVDDITFALIDQKQSDDWKKDGGKYIPNPATWLNQGRWKDEAGGADDRFAGAI